VSLLNAHAPPDLRHCARASLLDRNTLLGELTNLPTDTLLDIVFFILTGGQPLTLSEVGELEQIQLELQRRGELEGARLCQTAIGLGDR
jgi:hypothetical protein